MALSDEAVDGVVWVGMEEDVCGPRSTTSDPNISWVGGAPALLISMEGSP